MGVWGGRAVEGELFTELCAVFPETQFRALSIYFFCDSVSFRKLLPASAGYFPYRVPREPARLGLRMAFRGICEEKQSRSIRGFMWAGWVVLAGGGAYIDSRRVGTCGRKMRSRLPIFATRILIRRLAETICTNARSDRAEFRIISARSAPPPATTTNIRD